MIQKRPSKFIVPSERYKKYELDLQITERNCSCYEFLKSLYIDVFPLMKQVAYLMLS
jgi:hypothetical protein